MTCCSCWTEQPASSDASPRSEPGAETTTWLGERIAAVTCVCVIAVRDYRLAEFPRCRRRVDYTSGVFSRDHVGSPPSSPSRSAVARARLARGRCQVADAACLSGLAPKAGTPHRALE